MEIQNKKKIAIIVCGNESSGKNEFLYKLWTKFPSDLKYPFRQDSSMMKSYSPLIQVSAIAMIDSKIELYYDVSIGFTQNDLNRIDIVYELINQCSSFCSKNGITEHVFFFCIPANESALREYQQMYNLLKGRINIQLVFTKIYQVDSSVLLRIGRDWAVFVEKTSQILTEDEAISQIGNILNIQKVESNFSQSQQPGSLGNNNQRVFPALDQDQTQYSEPSSLLSNFQNNSAQSNRNIYQKLEPDNCLDEVFPSSFNKNQFSIITSAENESSKIAIIVYGFNSSGKSTLLAKLWEKLSLGPNCPFKANKALIDNPEINHNNSTFITQKVEKNDFIFYETRGLCSLGTNPEEIINVSYENIYKDLKINNINRAIFLYCQTASERFQGISSQLYNLFDESLKEKMQIVLTKTQGVDPEDLEDIIKEYNAQNMFPLIDNNLTEIIRKIKTIDQSSTIPEIKYKILMLSHHEASISAKNFSEMHDMDINNYIIDPREERKLVGWFHLILINGTKLDSLVQDAIIKNISEPYVYNLSSQLIRKDIEEIRNKASKNTIRKIEITLPATKKRGYFNMTSIY